MKGDIAKLKADPDDGTVPIARLFLDALPACKLSGIELRAILYLWRQTYGWVEKDGRRKTRAIPLEEWAERLNTTKSHCSEVLIQLINNNVFKRVSDGVGKGYTYEMNTRVSEWNDAVINKEYLMGILRVQNNGTVQENGTVRERGTQQAQSEGVQEKGTVRERGTVQCEKGEQYSARKGNPRRHTFRHWKSTS